MADEFANLVQQWAIECDRISRNHGMDVIFGHEKITQIKADDFCSDSDWQAEAEAAYLSGRSPLEFMIHSTAGIPYEELAPDLQNQP